MRPLIARIDTQALRHNMQRLRGIAGTARLMTLLKANAYGHDLVLVARALADLNERLAVACLDEAVALRNAGIRTPVLILQGPYSPDEWDEGLHLGKVEWVIHHPSQWDWIRTATGSAIWLKFNTGMGRLGLPASEVRTWLDALQNSHHQLRGIMTHYACADEPEGEHWHNQHATVSRLAEALPGALDFSASNSAALFNGIHPRETWARPGISLYGASPYADRSAEALGLKPVMTLISQVIAVNRIRKGETVGYGATWTAPRDSRIAVVAAGYGDGYPRHARTGTPVRVAGHRVPLVGRVSMDMLTVDVTDYPDVDVGAPVELWGPGLSVDEVARHADTISYTLTTGLTARVPRQAV
ncbi:alanine racemase [Hahella sp. SMD15-11]|uniref:Alanine racemase n=1 Tax=Thermohahella caldifontis TaxID=3142973 RepID=A0AB39V0R6_9GAMM